jgi:acyl-CoA synthetase (AMP-forming)/AMP-acid ligase II
MPKGFGLTARHRRAGTLHRVEVAFLQFPGGTIGVAKGALPTHGNRVAKVLQLLA